MKNAALALLIALSLGSAGCLGAGKWGDHTLPKGSSGLQLQPVSARSDARLDRSTRHFANPAAPRIPEIPVRDKLRFCCAFGTDLGVKAGAIPLPWIRVGRFLDVEDLGPHRYDGETAAIDDERKAFPKGEHNGMMYTCRGGFIDTAHVRETVDWAAYFIAKLDRNLEQGSVMKLGSEGGERTMTVQPIPTDLIAQHGRDEVIIALSRWLAHQVMNWHEIAQWYGWSILSLYPERVSGFSPEDIYSNAVGARLLDGVDIRRELASEKAYDAYIDEVMASGLEALEPVPKALGRRAVKAVDQVWWDSSRRLPDTALVRRRYLEIDTEVQPWLLPDELLTPELREELAQVCGEDPEPDVVHVPDRIGDLAFDDIALLEIEVGRPLSKQALFESMGGIVRSTDFPMLLELAREQNRAEFGLRADLPD